MASNNWRDWSVEWRFHLLNRPYRGVTEGPVWDGEAVYFTHIPTSRIMRYDPGSGQITEWRTGTNHANGLAFDLQGRLYGCCSGGRSIVRFEDNGTTTTIAYELGSHRLNTPNDLAIDNQGRVWFTNPWNAGNVDPSELQELDHREVLRADPQADGSYVVSRATFGCTMPNGILVSPDQQTLYVAERNSAEPGRNRELWAYPIKGDGTLGTYRVLHTRGRDSRGAHRGIDSMCLDVDGNIIATAGWELAGHGPLIYVFSPTGRVLETHPVSATRPTNCCFGGSDMGTPFVTSTNGHFFRVETERVGWTIYP